MNNKEIQYKELVKDVARCKICDDITIENKDGSVIKLTHDENRVHINLWSHWQGSLDAKILLIGQDWGRLSGEEEAYRCANRSTYITFDNKSVDYSITNINLWTLFSESLGIDISKPNEDLFFTNSIQCYKTGSLSNKTDDKWFNACNQLHIRRLINIIKPIIIIPVGIKALLGLTNCGEFYRLNGEAVNVGYFKQKFVNLVEAEAIKLQIQDNSEKCISYVCPVFHCGVLSCNLNRSLDKQVQDWKRISKYL